MIVTFRTTLSCWHIAQSCGLLRLGLDLRRGRHPRQPHPVVHGHCEWHEEERNVGSQEDRQLVLDARHCEDRGEARPRRRSRGGTVQREKWVDAVGPCSNCVSSRLVHSRVFAGRRTAKESSHAEEEHWQLEDDLQDDEALEPRKEWRQRVLQQRIVPHGEQVCASNGRRRRSSVRREHSARRKRHAHTWLAEECWGDPLGEEERLDVCTCAR